MKVLNSRIFKTIGANPVKLAMYVLEKFAWLYRKLSFLMQVIITQYKRSRSEKRHMVTKMSASVRN